LAKERRAYGQSTAAWQRADSDRRAFAIDFSCALCSFLKLPVLFFLLIVHHCTIILHLYNVFVERPGIVLGLNEVEKSPALSKDATHG
jgi:hypothetical protein